VWTQESILTASDKVAIDYFGSAVSLSADGLRLAVGAISRDSGGIADVGAVYHYTRSGSVWTQESILTASDKAAYDHFGSAVSLSADGSRLAVGASDRYSGGIIGSGAVYHYI
jgi:hypothetical protein